jgi:hypothetical protein
MSESPRRGALLRAASLLTIALAALAAALAQAPPNPAPSAAVGTTIVLPHRVVTGERATLAVLDAAGRLAPGVTVEFTGGEHVTTDVTGRASFVAPAEAGVLLVRLTGRAASASTTVIAPPTDLSNDLEVREYPRVVALSDRLSIDGLGFRGDADENRILLGDQPALVLAASPVSLVALPGPRSMEGATQLVVEVKGRSPGPVPVTLVVLRVIAPDTALKQGDKGTLGVRAFGSDQRLVVEVRNQTPEIIELPRGAVQRITTSGGRVNKADVEIVGLKKGDFSVSVRLVPGVYGLPDMETVRQKLLAARSLATSDWQERLDRVIRRIERDPQDVTRIRDDLEKMLAEKPPAELGRAIEAAWREFLKR